MTVGERIRKKRIELGLSQAELAKRMGLTNRSTVCKVEKGSEDNLTTDRIANFAKGLGVTPGYLMGWEDDFQVEMEAKAMAESALNSGLIKYLMKENIRQQDNESTFFACVDILMHLDEEKQKDALKYLLYLEYSE